MSVRIQITLLVYMMVQAVMFGAGFLLIEATGLRAVEMSALPLMVAITAVLAAPVSWWIAPRLRARYWRARDFRPDLLSG